MVIPKGQALIEGYPKNSNDDPVASVQMNASAGAGTSAA
jgi:hypothetical protein